MASTAGAQEAEGFPLPANTAFCEPGYFGPLEGCTPWEGVPVLFVSDDGTFSDSCVTIAALNSANCTVQVPFGSTITASIDPAAIPAGYVLEGASSVVFTIPDGPPEGLFGGPTFVLLPADTSPTEEPAGETPIVPESEGFPLLAFTAICEPGYLGVFEGCTPWEGVPVSVVALDREFAETCITVVGDRAASCVVNVPFGATIVASIMPSEIPDGYVLEGDTAMEYTIPDGPPEGEFGGPSFVLFAQEPTAVPSDIIPVETPVRDAPATDDTAGLVIRLPNTGDGPGAGIHATESTSTTLLVAGVLMALAGVMELRRRAR
jgi:hypothetical protein